MARLERLGFVDPLTAVFNRGYLDQRMDDEIKRARRYVRPLAIAMIDVDRFDQLTQTLGRLIGDRILREVARRVCTALRTHDVVARFGADTFLVLMPETEAEAAQAVATRLLRTVAAMAAESLPPGLPPDACTASVGLAVLRPTDDAPALILRARDALDAARRRGGNGLDGPL